MTAPPVIDGDPAERLVAMLAERSEANAAFFTAHAEPLARLCHLMAERFARGGRLLAFGHSPAARSDVRHVAVEFVHPVIVGKRALPAIGLTDGGAELELGVKLIARSEDIAMAFASGPDDEPTARAVATARSRGCLTVGFSPMTGAEWEFIPPSDDPQIRQELVETLYHVLWELVHVFFDHRGLLTGRTARVRHDAGASSFLYPFLAETDSSLETVVEDVRRSALMKSEETGTLRMLTLSENQVELIAAADALRAAFDSGAKLLALGNGGSATDAMDLVADLRSAGRPAIDLSEDPSILTAIANDVGIDAVFSRQVIAHGLAGDVLVTFSTSGNSANVIAALAEARDRAMTTVAMLGYHGGRIGAERLADYLITIRSEHIPRIQEAQASAYHCLCALTG